MKDYNESNEDKITNLTEKINTTIKKVCEHYGVEYSQELVVWVDDIMNLSILRNRFIFDDVKTKLHKYGTPIIERQMFNDGR